MTRTHTQTRLTLEYRERPPPARTAGGWAICSAAGTLEAKDQDDGERRGLTDGRDIEATEKTE